MAVSNLNALLYHYNGISKQTKMLHLRL